MIRLCTNDTPIDGLKVIQRSPLYDERGFFVRLFCSEELAQAGWKKPIAQINHTMTRKRGTVRGLHFQNQPHAEMKLVMCLRGVIWDVAVDLRRGSRTFLHWHAEELSATNGKALLIPEGLAHGFQTIADGCELVYLHSAAYAVQSEGAINAKDPKLSIEWPEPIIEMSDRDRAHEMLSDEFTGLII